MSKFNFKNQILSDKKKKKVGLSAIFEKVPEPQKKMDALRLIVERFRLTFGQSLKKLLGTKSECEVISTKSMQFKDVESSVLSKKDMMIIVFDIDQGIKKGIMSFNDDLVFGFVSSLLGGKDASNSEKGVYKRKIKTFIEQSVIRKVANVALEELKSAFSVIKIMDFSLDRVALGASFAQISQPKDFVFHSEIRLDSSRYSGTFDLIFPYDNFFSIPYSYPLEEVVKIDEKWSEVLVQNAMNVKFAVKAVMPDKKGKKLEDIFSLNIGDTVFFGRNLSDKVSLVCNDIVVASGYIGETKNGLAVKISEKLV